MTSRQLRVGFIEPHLEVYGGIRRILELSNRLTARGHDVRIYLPPDVPTSCDWMPCHASVRSMPGACDDELDVLLFNHEPQWHLLEAFPRAHRRAFLALHYAALYDKPGAWESLHVPVDLRLANSNWTADRISEVTGERPVVLPSGIDTGTFHPVAVRKRYPILCVGDDRWWKGTATVRAAAERLGLPVETYADKDLRQEDLAAAYSAAEVFVVGSRFEGFGQPGLEALACGTPLVTTDNGGCREYAFHEETALVVPPDDPEAMAEAIDRVRRDRDLAARLVRNGLDLVRERFDWDRSADALERELRRTVAADPAPRGPLRPETHEPDFHPRLSVVVLAWDQLPYTQWCVDSLRWHTDVPYELIIVDNGSGWEARNYASAAADRCVMNDANLGFAVGMNQGWRAARGDHVAFVNNDTEFRREWASPLVGTLQSHPRAGIVVPAITAARNPRTVRLEPGNDVETLDPFEPPPAAVVYVMDCDIIDALGGWGEEFPIASAEDVDLAFKVWVNDLDVVYDTRVVVDHASKGTAVRLGDWSAVWQRNRELLIRKWTAPEIEVPRLSSCPLERFERNLRTARAVMGWMDRYFSARTTNAGPVTRGVNGAQRIVRHSDRLYALLHGLWQHIKRFAPPRVRDEVNARFAKEGRIERPRDRTAAHRGSDEV